MSEQTQQQIGKILTGSEARDAIHFAVAPVEAAERLYPGQRVGTDGSKVSTKEPHVGIVDPFLAHPVLEGERCWLFLFPNTITALRHNWTHPAFTDLAQTTGSASEKYLRGYAERAGISYQRLLEGAESYLKHGEGLNYGTDLDSFLFDEKETFWHHFEAVTGIKVPDDKKDSQIFWCSC